MNTKGPKSSGKGKDLEVISIHDSFGVIPLFLLPRRGDARESSRYIPSSPKGRERRILMRERLLNHIISAGWGNQER